MLEKLLLNLQLFADGGGDGGDGGSASASVGEGVGSNDSGEDKILASIPEKAKKHYLKAKEQNKSGSTTDNSANAQGDRVQTTNEQTTTEKPSYSDLIKSDDYKEDHEAYVKNLVSDRLKKYKGIEENLGKQKALLDTVALKYGVSPEDENFLEVLAEKVEADDSYYENYAMEHDISEEEARRVVTMERKAAQYDAQREEMERQEQMRQHIIVLRQNAEKTKAQFPDFDLETEMEDERFRRLCAVNNGDTTAAYITCHWNEILPATVQRATRQAQSQTAQAVASNQARPIENGLSSTAPSVVETDYSKMNLQQIKKQAEEWRRKQTGR